MGRPSLSRLRVPAQPLLDRIQRYGGLQWVLADAGIQIYRRPEDAGQNYWPASRECKTYEKAIERGRRRGWFDLFWVDEFTVKMWGVHPVMVYPDWYELQEDAALQRLLAFGPEEERSAA